MIKIKELRNITGLSQNQFANKYKIPAGTIRNWEQGKRKCVPYIIYLLERVIKEIDYKEEK